MGTGEQDFAGRTALWARLATLRSRFSFRFSATGNSAAALVVDGRGRMFLEFWSLHAELPACERLAGFEIRADDTNLQNLPTEAVPFDDGSVLVVFAKGDRHEFVSVAPDGGRSAVAEVPLRRCVVEPVPDGTASALVLGRDAEERSSAWWLPKPAEAPSRLGSLPDVLLRGGGWADSSGDTYALNVKHGALTWAGLYRLPAGTFEALQPEKDAQQEIQGSSRTILLTAPETRDLLVADESDGAHEVCLLSADGSRRRLRSVEGIEGDVRPLASHPGGRWTLLQARQGLREQAVLLDAESDTARVLSFPTDRALGHAAWSSTRCGQPRVWLLSVGVGIPTRVLGTTVDVSNARESGRWVDGHDDTEAGSSDHWAPGHIENFPGADAEVEAIVCGYQDWRSAEHVVLALHGGPAGHWNLKFSQLFQVLAAAGLTVIAPNVRGSTGNGDEYHRQIVNAWGGPDLADVAAVARHVRDGRPAASEGPLLYGHSYGAFLALLAACAHPDLWPRVVAVAPFESGRSLHDMAAPGVRAMIERLGGCETLSDHLGPRDLSRQLGKLEAPLLMLHGERDQTIPVAQSRQLSERLERLGKRAGKDFHFVEVPGAGHTPLDSSEDLHLATARFLATGDWNPSYNTADDERR